mgnify:CR=1 FL=1
MGSLIGLSSSLGMTNVQTPSKALCHSERSVCKESLSQRDSQWDSSHTLGITISFWRPWGRKNLLDRGIEERCFIIVQHDRVFFRGFLMLDRKPRLGTTRQVLHNMNFLARGTIHSRNEKNNTLFTKVPIGQYINCSSYNWESPTHSEPQQKRIRRKTGV